MGQERSTAPPSPPHTPDSSDLEGEGAPRRRGLQVQEEQSRARIPEGEAGADWEEARSVPTSPQMWGARWIPQCLQLGL